MAPLSPPSPPRRQQDAAKGGLQTRVGTCSLQLPTRHVPPGTPAAESGPTSSVRGAELGSGEPLSAWSVVPQALVKDSPLQVVCLGDALKTQPALAILHSRDEGTVARGLRLPAGRPPT